MAFTPETGEYKATRTDVWMVDPRALIIDWRKNLSRGGEDLPIDEELMALALDMMPKSGGDIEADSSGQVHPVLVRAHSDRKLELVMGWRRTRAALWLIETGRCPDFKLKCSITRMTDAEAALVNMQENLLRADPKPIQLAYAVRKLVEGYGLSMKEIAGRLKKSVGTLQGYLDLLTLNPEIQASVAKGDTPLVVAAELGKFPNKDQSVVFDELSRKGVPVTAGAVRSKRRERQEAAAAEAAAKNPAAPAPVVASPLKRTMKEFRTFLEGQTGPEEYGKDFAIYLLDFLDGNKPMDLMLKYWKKTFKDA